MATKECANHKKKILKKVSISLLIVMAIVGIIALATWLVLDPKKPSFMIQDATFYNFSVNSSPDLFTSIFQVTIASRNPNARIGNYYRNLNVFANYRDQIISEFSSIPPTYQGHKDTNIWTPFIIGISTPISPYNVYALNQDQARGAIPLTIKIIGKLRRKVRSIKSVSYDLQVTCPVIIPYSNEFQDTIAIGTSFKYQISDICKVDYKF